VPAHDGDAEHAWKDGDSWRCGGDDEAIVDALTRNDVGDTDDRGGLARIFMEPPHDREGRTPSTAARTVSRASRIVNQPNE